MVELNMFAVPWPENHPEAPSMSNRLATFYRTRRSFRWPANILLVLFLAAIVALAHTLIFSNEFLQAPFFFFTQ
jgi:hypothetical protein